MIPASSKTYLIALYTHRWTHPTPPHHLFQFSKKSIKFLLSKNGYIIEKIIDDRIDRVTSFGSRKAITMNLRSLLSFSMLFPISFFAPFFKCGDSMYVIARKK